jgi:hypothetical protein
MRRIHFPPRADPAHPADARRSAAAVLGPLHPLVRTIEALSAVVRQCVVVVVLLAGGLIAAASGAVWGFPVAGSAALVLLFLAMAGGLLLQRRRAVVIALIAAGDEDVPLRVVERERRRLLSRRMRTALARSLDALVAEAKNPPAIPSRPLFNPTVVAQVAPELREVAVLLRSETPDARAVVLVWRLICDGVMSPLHRGDADELRAELARIRFMLQAKRA